MNMLEQVQGLYAQLNASNAHIMASVYAEDIEFIDPFHRIVGIDNLVEYVRALYQNASHVRFEFKQQFEQQESAILIWDMAIMHPRLNRGRMFVVPGCSHILFREKIHYHRDYFDAGNLLYEHLPLLGAVIRTIKRRMQ